MDGSTQDRPSAADEVVVDQMAQSDSDVIDSDSIDSIDSDSDSDSIDSDSIDSDSDSIDSDSIDSDVIDSDSDGIDSDHHRLSPPAAWRRPVPRPTKMRPAHEPGER